MSGEVTGIVDGHIATSIVQLKSARLRGTRRNQRKAKAATPALQAQPRAVMFHP